MSTEMLERRFALTGARKRKLLRTQGELVFVPAPEVDPPVTLVLFDERLSRGRGKLHLIQFAYRRGPDVFAKGAIRHPDHATVVLRGWHRVAMNIERIT